jgi:hypothetical protein
MEDRRNNQTSIEEAEISSSRSSSTLFFNDASCSDVVVRLMHGPGDGISNESESLDLHRHRSILVENSSYFSAQLSDRWANARSRDASGRPVLEVRGCANLQDFLIALMKLYEKAPGDPEKCTVHVFSSFEDALRCLKPAEQLGLSPVLLSAVKYLESIPWRRAQEAELQETLAHISFSDPNSVLSRTEKPSEDDRTALLNELFLRATTSPEADVVKGARSFIQKLVDPHRRGSQPYPADLFAAGLRRSLSILAGNLNELKFETPTTWDSTSEVPKYQLNAALSKLVGNLSWIFQLPQHPGETDVRRDVAELMTLLQTKCEPELYKGHIFHRYIAEPLFLPVMTEVAEGKLVLDPDLRMKLLQMWVPRMDRNSVFTKYPHPEAMQAAFNAVLSTLAFPSQKRILHSWLSDLVAADPWEPWFEEWMETNLLSGSKVRSLCNQVNSSLHLPRRT